MWKIGIKKKTRSNCAEISSELSYIIDCMRMSTNMGDLESYSKMVSNLALAQKNLIDSYYSLDSKIGKGK